MAKYKVSWAEVENGDIVWLLAYSGAILGPFVVEDNKQRSLMNTKNRSFLHVPEDLMMDGGSDDTGGTDTGARVDS